MNFRFVTIAGRAQCTLPTRESRTALVRMKRRTPGLKIRPARVSDVPEICELIRPFADQKLMIMRSLGELYESVREFHVAESERRLLGCAAVHVFWEDLAELKCLAVAEPAQRQGI